MFSLTVIAAASFSTSCPLLNEHKDDENNKDVHVQMSNIQNSQLPSSQDNKGKGGNVYYQGSNVCYTSHSCVALMEETVCGECCIGCVIHFSGSKNMEQLSSRKLVFLYTSFYRDNI
jgi:hypothetical protein